MRVDSSFSNSQPGSSLGLRSELPSSSFKSTLDQAMQAGAAGSAKPAGPAKIVNQEEKAEAIQAANAALWEAFREYMSKSPAEQMRELVLKEMNLSEEDLAAMPPDKRQAIEAEISDRIKERMFAESRSRGGEDATAQPVPKVAKAEAGQVDAAPTPAASAT